MVGGQELLLRDGMSDPICDAIPHFSEESNAPIFGKVRARLMSVSL